MSIEKRLEALEQRLQQVEDELAIRNVMTRYGLAVDCGDADTAAACHIEDALYTVSAPQAGREDAGPPEDLLLKGRRAIREMLTSELHQSLLPDCAHTVGPVCVELDGLNARATGYSRLYRREGEVFGLMRLAINEWRFQKVNDSWLIQSRESRLLGEEQAQQLLLRAAFQPGNLHT